MSSAPPSPAAVTSQFVNPFIGSVRQVFELMLGCEARRTALRLDDAASRMKSGRHEISCVIGITGRAKGTMVLRLGREVACAIHERLLGHREQTLTAEVADAVGEVTNMIAGGAKAKLADMQLSISVPNLIVGRDHEIWLPSNVRILVIEFTSPIGEFTLEVGLTSLADSH